MEDWAEGGYSASFKNEHIVRHAGAQGYCSAMKELLSDDLINVLEPSNAE